MRKYVDLKLWCCDSNEELKFLIDAAEEMGYWAVGIACKPENFEKARKAVKLLRSEGKKVFISVEVSLESPNDLRTLSKLLKKKAFVSAVPNSLEMTRRAVKSGVDSIVLSAKKRRLFFDSVCAKDLARKGGGVEVHLIDLIKSDRGTLIRALRAIRLELKIARKYGIPLISSSGASKKLELMDPLMMASLAETLLEIPVEAALNSISDYPHSLLLNKGLI